MGAAIQKTAGACVGVDAFVLGADCVAVRKRQRTEPGEYAPITEKKLSSTDLTARYRRYDGVEQQRVLGRGACGPVLLGHRVRDGAPVALKKVQRDSEPARAELGALRLAHAVGRHPTIVELLDVCDDEAEAGSFYILLVIEHMAGGELYRAIVDSGGLTEGQARARFGDIMGAVAHLHSVGVCHRDLKPENLLLAAPSPDAKLKIADLGVCALPAESSAADQMKKMCGTICFSAPEVWGESSDPARRGRGYTNAVDIFSAGIVLFAMVAGYHPFDPFDEYEEEAVVRRMGAGVWGFADPNADARREGGGGGGDGDAAPPPGPWVWDTVSNELKALIRALLEPDDTLRPSALRVLADPWLAMRVQTASASGGGGAAGQAAPAPAPGSPGGRAGARMADFLDTREAALRGVGVARGL